MNRQDAAILLATVSAFDRRTLGDGDVIAWQAALYDVALPDATKAVTEHFRTSTEWVTPAHVLAGVKRIRASRLPRECPDPIPPCDPDDVDSYKRQLLEARQARAAGAGNVPVAALTAGNPLGEPVIPAGVRGGSPSRLGATLGMSAGARAELAAARRRLAAQNTEGDGGNGG